MNKGIYISYGTMIRVYSSGKHGPSKEIGTVEIYRPEANDEAMIGDLNITLDLIPVDGILVLKADD